MSWWKRHTWHATSVYLWVDSGISGMKHTVKKGQRVMQRADQLPQLRHCAVMDSAPLRLCWNSCVPKVRQNAIFGGGGWRIEDPTLG